MDPAPQGNVLRAVFALAEDDVWAAGDGATLMHLEGNEWSGVSGLVRRAATGVRFDALWARSSSDVWVAGSDWNPNLSDGGSSGVPFLIHGDGQDWLQIPLPLGRSDSERVVALSGDALDETWALTNRGHLVRVRGTSAGPVETVATVGYDLHVVVPGRAYIAAGDLLVYDHGSLSTEVQAHTHVEGAGFTVSERITGIDVVSHDDIWAISSGGLLHKVDGAWQFSDPLLAEKAHVFAFSNDDVWWTEARSLGYLGSMDAEVEWGPDLLLPHGIHGIHGKRGFAVGDRGLVSTLEKNVAHQVGGFVVPIDDINPIGVQYSGGYNLIQGVAADNLWFGGRHSQAGAMGMSVAPLLKHFDGEGFATYRGDDWRLGGGVGGSEALSIHAIEGGPVTVIASGLQQLLPGDAMFARASLQPKHGATLLWGPSATDLWAVSGMGYIEHFDGLAWSDLPDPFPNKSRLIRDQVKGVWGTSSEDIWLIGRDPVAWHYDGANWSSVALPRPMDSIWGRGSDDVYAAGRGCVVHFDSTTVDVLTPDSCAAPDSAARCAPFNCKSAISGSDTELWVTDTSDIVSRFDGSSWQELNAGTRADSVYCVAPGDVWITGQGSILRRKL